MTYSEKLQDPRWQKKRLEIMSRDMFRCVKCDDETNTLTVHHFYYISGRNPWEYQSNSMQTLCRDCHAEIHDESYSRMTFFDSWEHSACFEIGRQVELLKSGEQCDEGFSFLIEQAGYHAGLRQYAAMNLLKEAADAGLLTRGWFLKLQCEVDISNIKKGDYL